MSRRRSEVSVWPVYYRPDGRRCRGVVLGGRQIRELLPALMMVERDLSIGPDAEAAPSRPSTPAAGPRRLRDYRILRKVGRNGMSLP